MDKYHSKVTELTLPIVYLEADSEIGSDKRTNIGFKISNADVTEISSLGTAKIRGGMSIGYPKKSFSLKLDESIACFDLPKSKEWILNANFIDKTFMRHKLSYDLFREINAKNITSESNYVILYLNGNLQGLYLLMQRINEDLLDLDKKDKKAVIFKDPVLFFTDDRLNAHRTDPYPQNFPKKKSSRLTDEMIEFRNYILTSDDQTFFDNEIGIASKMNMESIVDWYIFLMLSNGGDGLVKNYFLYRKNEDSLFDLTIWDCDHSFGRDGDGELNMMERSIRPHKNILLKRLLTNTNFNNKVAKRWNELREKGVISKQHIFGMIEENDLQIKEAIQLNNEIWSNDQKYYFDSNSYEQEIVILKEFIRDRITQLDEIFVTDQSI